MLRRQRTLLALLDGVRRPLSLTSFVKLTFLLREETEVREDSTFYAFVPYRFGPFSFALYRELEGLSSQSYVIKDEKHVRLGQSSVDGRKCIVDELPAPVRSAVQFVVARYGTVSQKALVRDVYARFPWYATKSELTDLLPAKIPALPIAKPAVYTAGYERRSVDEFFDHLLHAGIRMIADVRSHPVSRKYGFARGSLSGIAAKLGIGYRHLPSLGVPSNERAALGSFESYQRLLDRYERHMLPAQTDSLIELCTLVQSQPTVLLCMEYDARYCHRSRLAKAVAARTGLPVTNL